MMSPLIHCFQPITEKKGIHLLVFSQSGGLLQLARFNGNQGILCKHTVSTHLPSNVTSTSKILGLIYPKIKYTNKN